MTICFAHAKEKYYRTNNEPIYENGSVKFYTVRRNIDGKRYRLGIADAKNNVILPVEYYGIWRINDYGAVVSAYDYKNKKYNKGYFSFNERRFVLPCEYEYISCGHKAINACQIIKDDKYGYVSYDGKELIPMEYKSIEVYYSDMLKSGHYKADKKYFIIAEDFNNKKCTYTIYSDSNDKWKSAKLTDCIYDEIEQIYSSRFSFKKDGKQGEISFYNYLDEKGSNKFVPYEYDNIVPFGHNDGVYMVEKDGKKGIYREYKWEGGIIVPIGYDSVEYMEWGLYKFCKAGKCGAYDKNTQRLIEPKYKDIIPVSNSKVRLITDKTNRVVSRHTFGEKVGNFVECLLFLPMIFAM